MATLAPCLDRLRDDIHALAPGQDRASDGWIGDPAHQAEKSDHNPDAAGVVHAIDEDDDLNYPNLSMEMIVQHLLSRCRSGAENRLTYIIYNRRIWEASNGWRQRAYTGSSPHTEHAHFSCSYTAARANSTASWRLEDIPIMLTDADRAYIKAESDRVITAVNKVAEAVVDRIITDYSGTEASQSLYDWTAKTNVRHNVVVAKLNEVLAAVATPPPPSE